MFGNCKGSLISFLLCSLLMICGAETAEPSRLLAKVREQSCGTFDVYDCQTNYPTIMHICLDHKKLCEEKKDTDDVAIVVALSCEMFDVYQCDVDYPHLFQTCREKRWDCEVQ